MRSKGWQRWLARAALVIFMLGVLLAFAARQRARRVEQIRNELRQLEVGMTMQEVRDSLTIAPSSKDADRAARPDEKAVVWWFSTAPGVEAVQPHIVFDSVTGRLVEIVPGTGRHAKTEPSAVDGDVWLGDWLERNEPIVRNYLLGLGSKDIGRPLPGARLTDGTRLFAGDVFLGAIDGIPAKAHGFLFQRDDAKFACLWADADGPALRLPRCADPNVLEHEVISRDVYTYGEIHPGGRIVIVWCPSDDWLH